jgi:hypothetical protein
VSGAGVRRFRRRHNWSGVLSRDDVTNLCLYSYPPDIGKIAAESITGCLLASVWLMMNT